MAQPITFDDWGRIIAGSTLHELGVHELTNFCGYQTLVDLTERGINAETVADMMNGYQVVAGIIEEEKRRRGIEKPFTTGSASIN